MAADLLGDGLPLLLQQLVGRSQASQIASIVLLKPHPEQEAK